MSQDELSYEDLLRIIELIERSSRFSELHLKVGDIEIDLRMKGGGDLRQPAREGGAEQAAAQGGEVSDNVTIAAAGIARGAAPAQQFPEGSVLIRSPMVGTFYRAPEPGARPFVEIGSRVTAETTICIIEVMKLMSSIAAGYNGVITHIPVNDAQLVEAEQVLMVIDPAPR